jgi:hypothetical protein
LWDPRKAPSKAGLTAVWLAAELADWMAAKRVPRKEYTSVAETVEETDSE